MKGSEIYDSVVARCLEHGINVYKYAGLFYSAVLCMGQKLTANDDDIYKKHFKYETGRLTIEAKDGEPAFKGAVEIYNETGSVFKGVSYYLSPGTEILKVHIEIYKTLTKIVPELWEPFGPIAGSRELTEITIYLFSDIVKSVAQLHAKHN